MSRFSENLIKFTREYNENTASSYKGSSFGDFIRNELANSGREVVPENYIVKGSAGQGNWAKVPWLGVFHPLETRTAQQGFYAVYLVNPPQQTITLSMNQGVTQVQSEYGQGSLAHETLRTRASILRSRAGPGLKKFDASEIDLSDAGGNGAWYESGHAYGRTYTISDLSNAEKVHDDLRTMLDTYNHLLTNDGYVVPPDNADEDGDSSVVERKKLSLHKRYDRIGSVGEKVKKRKGYTCEACGLNFKEKYGELGSQFIEVHHLVPFSDLKPDMTRTSDIDNDFAVLCANCHRMIHRQDDPSDVEALREIIARNL